MTQGSQKPLWPCPGCGRAFANRNQSHACGIWDLDRHFDGKSPLVREIYDAFLDMLTQLGPVTVVPEKSRIAFQARMSFAQLTVRRHWVLGHFVLARRIDHPLFARVESISPRNHVHHFRLDSPGQVAGLRGFASEAYAVGRQEHVARGPVSPSRDS